MWMGPPLWLSSLRVRASGLATPGSWPEVDNVSAVATGRTGLRFCFPSTDGKGQDLVFRREVT